VKVEIYEVDRYKRLLSTLFLDGKDINLAMIEASPAEVYRGPESGNPYKQQYQAAEDAARSVKKGMGSKETHTRVPVIIVSAWGSVDQGL
jgi:endonuclease YncB( thermonuclease family)